MDNNMSNYENNESLDNIINCLNNQISILKERLEEERKEHREIYYKIKKENDELKIENDKFKNNRNI
tara:strand:- start:124 stop:324 length:201 start_codon:yes stop_codon:yes gene_type:complete